MTTTTTAATLISTGHPEFDVVLSLLFVLAALVGGLLMAATTAGEPASEMPADIQDARREITSAETVWGDRVVQGTLDEMEARALGSWICPTGIMLVESDD